MLDFMVWPWFERLPLVYTLSAEVHPNLANWFNLMLQEPAIKETACSKETHLKFYEGYLNSKPVYDFWTIVSCSPHFQLIKKYTKLSNVCDVVAQISFRTSIFAFTCIICAIITWKLEANALTFYIDCSNLLGLFLSSFGISSLL